MTKKSREENLNSKIQSVEKRIKELDFEKKKVFGKKLIKNDY